jgi:glycosyltransferase involved in cell wall biosynthesis
VLRAPVGGLFRHVLDLAGGQIQRGHRVGLVVDALSGGADAEEKLKRLAPALALGLSRVAMTRHLGLSDLGARTHVARRAREVVADVVHGHGAKGGAYARLINIGRGIRVYTPHGGSLHYSWHSGFPYLVAERALIPRSDLILFESDYGRRTFQAKLGNARRIRVVHNGVGAQEFAPVPPVPQARHLVFVGELRTLKGVDVLIEAIAILRQAGRDITAAIVGEGPQRATFEGLVSAHGLRHAIAFLGTRPARSAFALGRILVVPSRAESLPYIVLEAAAAGMPMLATAVGGMAEIFGPDAGALVTPGDANALARAIDLTWVDSQAIAAIAQRLQARVRASFSVDAMTDAVLAAYAEVLEDKRG